MTVIRRTFGILLAVLLATSMIPAVALADSLHGEYAATEGDLELNSGKPEAEDLTYEWNEFYVEPNKELSPLSLGEGTAADIVSIAQDQPDGVPSGGDYNKYNSCNGEPWCAYFIVWCAREAGVTSNIIPDYYACYNLARFYQDLGLWHSYTYTPKAGDLIFYSESSGGTACHVGIVTSVSDGCVYTKEGNTTGDTVSTRQRKAGASWVWNNWYIKGYASPNYAVHSHDYCERLDASYAPLDNQANQHSATYIAACACGHTDGDRSVEEKCSWLLSGSSYSCSLCSREFIMGESGECYELFPDVLDEINRFGGPSNVWYVHSGSLDYAVTNGLIRGYSSNGYFGAYDGITRGQVAVILHRMAGEPDKSAPAFEDVDYSEYYGPAIAWARSMGVISGYKDADGAYRTFGPNAEVTREELCAMLANYASKVGGIDVSTDGSSLAAMPDAGSVSDWACGSVDWTISSGLMSGDLTTGVALVNPQGTAWRAAMAKMASILHDDILQPLD